MQNSTAKPEMFEEGTKSLDTLVFLLNNGSLAMRFCHDNASSHLKNYTDQKRVTPPKISCTYIKLPVT